MPRAPFFTREVFERKVAAGEIKPDALFPILDYDFCKYVWEHSPLIQMAEQLIASDEQP